MSLMTRWITGGHRDRVDEIVIEPMSRRMLHQVMPIEQTAYPKPWSRAVFEGELEQVRTGTRHYVVARNRRRLVGYAGLWFIDDPGGNQAHVTNIVVAPDARRLGVGTTLMTALAATARDRGCVAWTLEVRASNVAAQALYRRFGFAPAGVRQRYYENTEDAIVMWCHALGDDDYLDRLPVVDDRAQEATS